VTVPLALLAIPSAIIGAITIKPMLFEGFFKDSIFVNVEKHEAMKELAEFEMRYWKAVAPETTGVSPEQMAAVIASYPLVKQGMERLNREKVNLKGTPLQTVTTFDAVKSAQQAAKDTESSAGSASGLSGMLARKMMKKDESKSRATIFTVTGETLEIATTVNATDLAIPSDFKQSK